MPTKREDSDIISQLFPDPKEPKDLETGITESLSEPISRDTNKKEGNCYCEKARNLNIVELLCAHCNRWFHESCIGHQLDKIVPFMMNYEFVCKNCSPSGLETFKKTPALFSQLCVTALGNLMQQSVREGAPQTQFSSDKHIIPFIDRHWDSMTTTRRATRSWQSAVVRALVEETNIVFACNKTATNGNLYSLMDADLTQIRPDYEAVIEGVGHVKVTDMGEMQKGLKNRNSKRKMLGEGGTGVGKKGRGVETVEHPLNKDGYRYIMAEPDPHAPYRQEFDGSSDYAGKPIPGWLYRAISPVSVRLAVQDRAPQLKVSEDCLTVTGEKGYYGTIRATHYVSRGCWYWEAVVEAMPEGSATRLGWAQEYASLQPPLGFDKFGYSWRSRKGTRFHEGRGKHYSRGYGEGDVLGCMILLPDNNSHIPQTYKDRPLVKFKSHLYYEEKYQITERLKNLKPLPESKIIFFKNGECQGEAFSDISAGAYYPTVSIHKSAKVSVNFGPDFKYPPPAKDYKYRGLWEKAEEAVCEQTMADLLYLTENEGKLRLDASP